MITAKRIHSRYWDTLGKVPGLRRLSRRFSPRPFELRRRDSRKVWKEKERKGGRVEVLVSHASPSGYRAATQIAIEILSKLRKQRKPKKNKTNQTRFIQSLSGVVQKTIKRGPLQGNVVFFTKKRNKERKTKRRPEDYNRPALSLKIYFA